MKAPRGYIVSNIVYISKTWWCNLEFTYKERSVIGTMLISLIVNIYYFSKAWEIYDAGTPTVAEILPLMGAVVVLLIILEITYEAVIATRPGYDIVDERDRTYEAKGERVSGFILAAGIYICLGHIIWNDVFEQLDSTTIFIAANGLILTLVIAEFTKGLIQLSAYRRGI